MKMSVYIPLLILMLSLISCQVKETKPDGGPISGHVPSATVFTVTTPLNTSYAPASTIPFTLSFPHAVSVTGTPRLTLTVGSTTRYADYVSGNGTSSLLFNYTVQPGENETNGIGLATSIDLNGGTLLYNTTENCSTTITSPNLTTVLVDSTAPTIVSVTPPSNGTYISGGLLNFSVKFSEKVYVTGAPRIPITLTTGTVYANYISGSGTDTLLMRYTVNTSDEDTNGITIQTVDLNSGTIKDKVLYDSALTYTAPNTSAVLVAGNTPTIASITLPANGRYLTGQTINFVVNFDQIVFVTLTPRLQLTLQNGTAYANYVSGGGTSSLTFSYTIASGDYDTDGITLVSPLSPNGGAIQNVTMTSNAILTFTPPNSSNIKIDGLDPVISSVTPPANGWFSGGSNMNFTVNYTTPVIVSGSPLLQMDVGGSSVNATYLSGSGTNALIFRYSVSSGLMDSDGIQLTSPLSLNGGTIKDTFNDNAGLTFTLPTTSGVLVDSILPAISGTTAPASATYFNAQNVDITINFSENVTVTGSPSISLTVGSSSKTATYTSGSGTNSLVFRYVVANGDLDSDGIVVNSPITLNAGTISDVAANSPASLAFTPPVTSGVLVDGTIASISSITPPSNSTYKTSNNLDFTVHFTRSVTVSGSPRLQLDVGGATAYATYLSGSGTTDLVMRYTVSAGDKDLNGLAVSSPLSLNGGTIIDSSSSNALLTFTPPSTSGVLVDGIDLVISTFTPPADKTYILNENIDFTLAFNDVAVVTGTPRIQLTVGSSTVYANYQSGSGTANLVFRYSVGASDVDTDGIQTVGTSVALNGGTINDEFGDAADLSITATSYPDKKVDGTVPLISSMSAPADGTYIENNNLDFVATMSEAVNITGSPRLTLTIGSTTKYAVYQSGSGTNLITFRYTVNAGDVDIDGIALASTLDLNSGTVKDLAGNDLAPLTFTPPSTTGILVNGVAPVITSITPPANGTFQTGTNLDFVVNYSMAVNVTGVPGIPLTIGASSAQATYISGSGTSALTFRYTVVAGDSDANGIQVTSPLNLNGGTIKDPGLTNASLTFTAPNTTAVLVDGIDIVVITVTPPANMTYKIADNLDFNINFSYPAYVTGSPRMQLTVGATTYYATYVSGSGTANHLYRFTVSSGDSDSDGITTVGPSLGLNGGTIKDAFGDNATLTFTPTTYTNLKVDGVRPAISSITPPADKTYGSGETLSFTVTYSENVSVTGTPQLALTIGAATRYATYASGSGTNAIVFSYTIINGEVDTDGIVVTSPLDPAAGTITDIPGNAQTNFSFTPPTLTNVKVDGVAPTIISISPPSSQTYGLSAQLNFTVTFSESVTVTGTPALSLNIGGSSVSANYVSGSGSTALVFRYTTVVNDSDTDGVASVSPVSGGTIKDTPGNNAVLTFSGATYAGVLVDALPPAISTVTPPTAASYKPAANLTFTVAYNEVVTVNTTGGTPSINMTIGSTTRSAAYLSGSGTNTLTFRYTLVSGDDDYDGLVANTTLQLNGGTIKDAALNNALTNLGTVSLSNVFTIPTELGYWYDLTSTTTVGSSTTTLTQFASKAGTVLNGTITGSPVYANTGFNTGTSGYTTLSSANYIALTNLQIKYAIIVYKTPTAASRTLLYDTTGGGSASSRVQLTFQTSGASGLLLGSNCSSCRSYNGSSWTTISSGVIPYTWSSGQYRILVIDYAGITNLGMRIGYNSFDGQIAELMFVTGSTALTNARIDSIKNYLNAKHGANY